MTRQQPTNPDMGKWALTPPQHAAVDLLAVGASVTDAAESIGVTRQTVSEWLHHHHGFRAALNQRRAELAPHGNPNTENFFDIVRALQRKTRVKLSVTARAA